MQFIHASFQICVLFTVKYKLANIVISSNTIDSHGKKMILPYNYHNYVFIIKKIRWICNYLLLKNIMTNNKSKNLKKIDYLALKIIKLH